MSVIEKYGHTLSASAFDTLPPCHAMFHVERLVVQNTSAYDFVLSVFLSKKSESQRVTDVYSPAGSTREFDLSSYQLGAGRLQVQFQYAHAVQMAPEVTPGCHARLEGNVLLAWYPHQPEGVVSEVQAIQSDLGLEWEPTESQLLSHLFLFSDGGVEPLSVHVGPIDITSLFEVQRLDGQYLLRADNALRVDPGTRLTFKGAKAVEIHRYKSSPAASLF